MYCLASLQIHKSISLHYDKLYTDTILILWCVVCKLYRRFLFVLRDILLVSFLTDHHALCVIMYCAVILRCSLSMFPACGVVLLCCLPGRRPNKQQHAGRRAAPRPSQAWCIIGAEPCHRHTRRAKLFTAIAHKTFHSARNIRQHSDDAQGEWKKHTNTSSK